MKKRSYYRLWTELLAKHPELSQNENYFDMIENGYEVVIGDLTFGKNEMRNAYDQYYVETKEPYGFDETRFNVYDDLIPDEIREYIPRHTIRAIRNAKSDFKKINGQYMVEFEYLPLQHKSVNDDRVFSAIKTLEFKIGDWLIIGDDKDIYRSTITDELTRKYNADFKSFVIIGEILTNNWHYKVVEEYRNKRDTDRMIRAILSAIRDHFYDKLTAPIPEKEPQYTADEMSDVIELATEFLSLPITTHFRSSLDIWRNGEAFFESKAETKDFIELVNNQNIKKGLAESVLKNPFTKYAPGGKIPLSFYPKEIQDKYNWWLKEWGKTHAESFLQRQETPDKYKSQDELLSQQISRVLKQAKDKAHAEMKGKGSEKVPYIYYKHYYAEISKLGRITQRQLDYLLFNDKMKTIWDEKEYLFKILKKQRR